MAVPSGKVGPGRPLRIGLYSAHFGTAVGGGEKYLAVAAGALKRAFPAHHVEIISAVPVDRRRYQDMLEVDLAGIDLMATNSRVTPVHRWLNRLTVLRPIRDRVLGAQAARMTRRYDLYLAMVYQIPVRSRARQSVILCQFPYPDRSGIDGFDAVICQSEYVRGWIRQYWDREAEVINPPIDIPAAEPEWAAKQPIVLSVGRFVATGHVKRHDLMVRTFARLCEEGLEGWELHLAGTVHQSGPHSGYFEEISRLAEGYPIRLHPDIPFADLQDLYSRASIYWHAAGYGVDESADPGALEHFGMATAEAMAHGAVPVVIARGGQLEVVREGVDGYLWSEPDVLAARTLELVRQPDLRRRLGGSARQAASRFSRSRFEREIVEALEPRIEQLELPG